LLADFGDPKPKIWRDVKQVERADQFDQKIEQAIGESSIFIAVLSRNWMASSYCRRELNAFAERWKLEGEMGVRQRIVLVGKRHVPAELRPSLLQQQEGYLFYSLDDPDEIGLEREFFVRGEVRDNRYYSRVEELASLLWRRAERFGTRGEQSRSQSRQLTMPSRNSRKAIYLAKPASDMRRAYDRLVTELTGSGYPIIPDPSRDIPIDASAAQFIDEALSQADVSIHLLGEKAGFAPDDAPPVVKLQLARAADKWANTEDSKSVGRLKRIIWAPKVLDVNSAEHGEKLRNPLNVLEKFDRYLPEDTVEGDTLSKFVELVIQRLSRTISPESIDEVPANTRIYVYHRPEDMEYAFDIGKALRSCDITPKFPAYEGPDAERVLLHRQHLRECDSVVVCWASAPDVWVKVIANELVNWKVLGRTKGFTRRGLVAGPPPGIPKRMFVELFPKDEIDVVVDLTACPHPQPEDLTALISAQ